MKKSCVLIILFCLICSCGSDLEHLRIDTESALTGIITLELTFGAEETISDEEYLLTGFGSIGVNNDNEILILDESRIKIYDENGKPIRIIGRPGQGPGEFESPRFLSLNPNGYYTVLGGSNVYDFSVFSPENKFIERRNYRVNPPYKQFFEKLNLVPSKIKSVFALNDTERVFFVPGLELSESTHKKLV